MKTITITGGTGLVGSITKAALLSLMDHPEDFIILSADHKLQQNADFQSIRYKSILFDYEDASTWKPLLTQTDTLFLLRPPQISDVKRVFKPLIDAIQESEIKHIVFLSVQGVPEKSIIPHHKIEELILNSGIPYTFLRPGYFMQNFEGNLKTDLIIRHQIYLPAGNAKFSVLDVADLGQFAAHVLLKPAQHLNKAYDLTGPELLTFAEMASIITKVTGIKITYRSAGLLPFIYRNWQKSVPFGLNLVMAMLHYAPRWMANPPITNCVEEITGQVSGSFEGYVSRELVPLLILGKNIEKL